MTPSERAGNSTPTPSPASGGENSASSRPAPPGGLSLGQAARVFFGYLSPMLLASSVLLALGARLWLGAWSIWDLAVVGAILAIWPLQEWLLHVLVLHYKPRELFGRRIDFLVSKKHRDHHRDPLHIPTVFIPLHIVIPSIPAYFVGALLLNPTYQLGLTSISFYFAMSLLYEWTHYLIHSSYRPRSRLYKRIWQNHRLHHFKNEHYWFGITMPFIDGWMGTAPDYKAVELSPTCRTLGVDEKLAAEG